MPHLAAYELAGKPAEPLARLLGITGDSPLGGALVEVEVIDDSIVARAHGPCSFNTLALHINADRSVRRAVFSQTDRATSIVRSEELEKETAGVRCIEMDPELDDIREVPVRNAAETRQRLNRMATQAMQLINRADFS